MFGLGGPKVTNITPSDVKAGLDAGRILLIDVREAAEFGSERIAGAMNHPLSRLDPNALKLPKDGAIVLHCASGMRSAKAGQVFAASGIEILGHMAGGISAWKAARLPTIS